MITYDLKTTEKTNYLGTRPERDPIFSFSGDS